MSSGSEHHTAAAAASARTRYEADTLIIGAGPGGLAVAACLRQAGVDFIVLEQTDAIAPQWRQHYDRLHLHTAKRFSALPYRPFPKQYPRYPARQQVVRYLEDYARQFAIEPHFQQQVLRAQRLDGGWLLETADRQYRARHLVVASGYNRVPQRPDWPGLAGFSGPVLHSSEYRNGRSFAGKKVLVVGFGNSGAEIALDLWEHGAHPAMAVRSPVNVLPREVLGMPTLAMGIWQRHFPARWVDALSRCTARLLVGDLRPYGLHPLAQGPMQTLQSRSRVPMLDVGTIALIKSGEIKVYPGIERLEGQEVVFTDGQRLAADALVLATGYRPQVQAFLADADAVLDAQGTPLCSGQATALAGLYFCGFYVSPAGMFREMGMEAKRIAAAIAAQQ